MHISYISNEYIQLFCYGKYYSQKFDNNHPDMSSQSDWAFPTYLAPHPPTPTPHFWISILNFIYLDII